MGQAINSASFEQRIERYRGFAKEAFRMARDANDKDLCASYLSMAAAWHSLAEEAELAMRHHPPIASVKKPFFKDMRNH